MIVSLSTENRFPRRSRSSLVNNWGCRLVCVGTCETCVIGEEDIVAAAMTVKKKRRSGDGRRSNEPQGLGELSQPAYRNSNLLSVSENWKGFKMEFDPFFD